MKIRLDTHTLIWFLEGHRNRLSEKARNSIEDEQNLKYVSNASIWEISLKVNIGKLELINDFNQLINLIDYNGFHNLPIHFRHLQKIISLELRHRDPFDRLLIAQALSENFQIVTKDPAFSLYPIQTIW